MQAARRSSRSVSHSFRRRRRQTWTRPGGAMCTPVDAWQGVCCLRNNKLAKFVRLSGKRCGASITGLTPYWSPWSNIGNDDGNVL